mmetsp:Transcript_93048/g.165507  ORF Transcript_93048/g.165507 Transcript_93048/m.165507 type:complete len:87 (-) Transcript_93048:510-770(-)
MRAQKVQPLSQQQLSQRPPTNWRWCQLLFLRRSRQEVLREESKEVTKGAAWQRCPDGKHKYKQLAGPTNELEPKGRAQVLLPPSRL